MAANSYTVSASRAGAGSIVLNGGGTGTYMVADVGAVPGGGGSAAGQKNFFFHGAFGSIRVRSLIVAAMIGGVVRNPSLTRRRLMGAGLLNHTRRGLLTGR